MALGDEAGGKTSLLKMYKDKKFDESHMATMGLDYVLTTFTPEGTDDELSVKIWDTSGQERFITLTRSFYKQANGIVVVFDVSNRDSFGNVKFWMESISDHADQNVCKIMVGNKIDIEDRRVTKKEA